ncbi:MULTISPECIES: DUF1858 domain-containing protein [Clostridium]|uniref:DUF1858 domain-containing protein n=1 Tax=Clostridium ragsdalei P11 TaxID=1353534 RepID=A0A1A6B1H9_9CLOT|nr:MULTISPECIES: DUF1858 domain-containing protein [Clostridium]OBR96152.1 hypothetical protein CLRAG_06030 [Clostridium ragsdalei P11]QXE18624.1 disulfide oxidoreductase [Clostridium sp. 001]
MSEITKNMTIAEIIKMNPKNAERLMTFGMGCVTCGESQEETLEEAANVHGLNADNLVRALNALS